MLWDGPASSSPVFSVLSLSAPASEVVQPRAVLVGRESISVKCVTFIIRTQSVQKLQTSALARYQHCDGRAVKRR